MKAVIDPGHGGTKKVGGSSPNNAVGPTGLKEKQVTLEVGLLTRTALENLGIDCILTRDIDRNLGLVDRAAVAKNTNADVFVSLHFNGFDGSAQGTETFHHTNGGENSKQLADYLQNAVLRVTGLTNRGVKSGSFRVINPAYHSKETAACLCEISFMDVPSEETRLKTEKYQNDLAAAIAKAIKEYLLASKLQNFDTVGEKKSDDEIKNQFEDGFDFLNQVR